MPKVLLLNDALANGGAERQLVLLARSLPTAWERRVWVMGDGPQAQVLRDHRIPLSVRGRARRLDLRPACDLWHTLLSWRPDVVHTWDWMSSVLAGPLCKLLGIPLVDGTIRMGMRPRRRAVGQSFG